MAYKTILLHLNDQRRVAGLVDAAAHLASRSQAHLIGLFVMPPLAAYRALSIGGGKIKRGLLSFETEAERVQAAFETACRGRPFVSEWRRVEANHGTVADVVMDHGHACDLVIASQRDRGWDLSPVMDEPERLAVESGRPVLLIPHAGHFATIGRRATVAWNGRREAARAVFDALPLLQAAEHVRIVWINPADASGPNKDVPTADIAVALARHGVKCEAAVCVASDSGIGDTLLSGLVDDGSDLLVMGAYGHARFREFVFGGATRHILEHMTVPVLMSH